MGPPMPLTRGLLSSRGRRRSPLPLIPWRRHCSLHGEAQREEAACYGWAVTPLGWRPACRAGPRDPATPLGLAGGGDPWRPGFHRSLARGHGTAVRQGLAGVPLPSTPLAGLPAGCPAVPPPAPWGGDSKAIATANLQIKLPEFDLKNVPDWAEEFSELLLLTGQHNADVGTKCTSIKCSAQRGFCSGTSNMPYAKAKTGETS